MKTSPVSVVVIAMFAVAVSLLVVRRPLPECAAAPTLCAEGTKMLGRLPVAFVPNLGQWEHAAQYVARVGAMTVFLEQQGWSFTLAERSPTKRWDRRDSVDEQPARGVAVRMTFAGARQPEMTAEERLPGAHNYFLGNDPSKWHSDVPLYGAVRYREVYSGVDVRMREHGGHFEYDLLLQPGADLEPVEMVVEGIDRMRVDNEGALVMETRLGPVRMPVPLSWEEGASGEKELIACQYELRSADRFGFRVTARRPGWALVVDPGLVWSTFLGGTGPDIVSAIALDAQGAATVAGMTGSADFPTTPGAFSTTKSSVDADAFVTRLSPTGSTLVYSTFLIGSGVEWATAIALDAQGAATVAGLTASPDFPTTPGAFDTSYNGVSDDGFVTRLSPTGSALVYSTFLGGTFGDVAAALALDAQGAATVAGHTGSVNFPTTPGAFDTSYDGGGFDGFVAQLSPTGSTLVYSTFLGGTSADWVIAVALDAQGAATVAGRTLSPAFPTTSGAFDTSYNGGNEDGFVTRLSPTGSSLVYSTFLGGASRDWINALALDAQGAATVAGVTGSTSFPTTPGAFATSYNGGNEDGFVTRLSPTGSTLVYSTFLGGAGSDQANDLALDAQGAATLAGLTSSTNLPTTPGAFDTSFAGSWDAFVARLDLLPTGVAVFGDSSPGCNGPLQISVNSMPQVGNAAFALTCGNAAPNSLGLISFASGALPTPVLMLGVNVWVHPTVLLGTVFSNPIGAGEVPLPIPLDPAIAGFRLFTQFLWLGPVAPPPCPPLGFSATSALDITIQP